MRFHVVASLRARYATLWSLRLHIVRGMERRCVGGVRFSMQQLLIPGLGLEQTPRCKRCVAWIKRHGPLTDVTWDFAQDVLLQP